MQPDSASPAVAPAPNASEAAPGVWRITTPMPGRPPHVHAYLVRLAEDGGGDGGWMLVDGGLGTDTAWAALDEGVRAVAGGWAAVRLHVVTHMHMDHVGLNERIRRACGAPLAMGRLDAERMAHAAAHPQEEAEYRLGLLRRCGAPDEMVRGVEAASAQARPLAPHVAASVMLDGEQGQVPGAPGWRWLWTPGHTAGHVSLWRAADRVLVAGDAVLPSITPTLGVNRQRADPVGDYLEALARVEALAPAAILPGHGDPPPDPAARLRELRDAATGETEAVAALLGDEALTPWEVVSRRYPGREMPTATRMLALRETLAHLDRLVAAGRAAETVLPMGAAGFARAAAE